MRPRLRTFLWTGLATLSQADCEKVHSPRTLAHAQIFLVRVAQGLTSTIHGTFTEHVDLLFTTLPFKLDSYFYSAVWPICCPSLSHNLPEVEQSMF